MSELIHPCDTDENLLKPIPSTQFLERCDCAPCWLAALLIFTPNPPGSDCDGTGVGFAGPGSEFKAWSIRSYSPAGTVLHLQKTWQNCAVRSPPATFLVKTDIVVGKDTGGEWVRQPAAVLVPDLGYYDFKVYMASFYPTRDDPIYCAFKEYGIPLHTCGQTGSPEFPTRNPGKVKWRKVWDLVVADYALDYRTCGNIFGTVDDVWFNIFPQAGCAADYATSVLCDACVPSSTHLNVSTAEITTGKQNRAFYLSKFTDPAACQTPDTAFNLIVTHTRLTDGGVSSATGGGCGDAHDVDYDVVPLLELADADPDESIDTSGITRLGHSNYRFNGVQFYCRKGYRQINVWPDHLFGSSFGVNFGNPYKTPSGLILVTAGAPFAVDLVPRTGGPPNYGNPVQARATLANLTTRILDANADFGVDYNIVDGATNTVVATLTEWGTNYLTSPALFGTASRAAVDGVAVFNDLSIKGLGRKYRITFTSSGLNDDWNNNGSHVNVKVATGLAFESLPSITAGVPTSIKVDLVDALGNVLSPTAADSLTLSGAGSFSGFGSVTPIAGVATFNGTFPSPGTFSIQVQTSGTNYDGPAAPVSISVTVNP